MIIDNIHYSGIREIYNYMQPMYQDWTVANASGTVHRNRMLNYCNIIITLHDISPIEFLMLQNFTGGTVVYCGSDMVTSETIPEECTEAEATVLKKILGFQKQIETSPDASNIVADMVGVPELEKCHAIVRFKGNAILGLFQQTSMVKVFQKWIGHDVEKTQEGTNQVMLKFPTWEDLHKEIAIIKPVEGKFEDFIFKTFMNGFYNFWKNEIRAQDIVSDGFIHNYSYNGLKYGQAVLQEIVCPQATILLGSADSEETTTEIQRFTKWAQEHSKLSRSEIIPYDRMNMYCEVQMTVNVRTSLLTFLKLVKTLPYHMINDYRDLLVAIGLREVIPIPEAQNFKIRKGQVIDKIWELNESYHQTNPLRMMNYIPYETSMEYTLMGSVADFTMLHTILNSWIEKQGEQGITVENSLVVKEVTELLQSIQIFVDLIVNTAGNVQYAD